MYGRFRAGLRTLGRQVVTELLQWHDVGIIDIPGMDFTIHADLAHTARNQLGVLGTEIQDQDPVGMDVSV